MKQGTLAPTPEGKQVPDKPQYSTHHLGLSVRGALMNWSDSDLRNILTRDDGSKPTVHEAKNWLMDQLAAGHEVVPMAECDNWDWKTGCKGHPCTEKQKAELDQIGKEAP